MMHTYYRTRVGYSSTVTVHITLDERGHHQNIGVECSSVIINYTIGPLVSTVNQMFTV